jgi:kumamolisin
MPQSPKHREDNKSIPANYVQLKGSERRPSPGAKLLGPTKTSETSNVTIVLRRRPDGPPVPDYSYYRDTPPSERQRLSSEEFARKFGADQADIDKVTAFVTGQGLKVLETHPARRTVLVSGTVEQFSRAFHVALNDYEHKVTRSRAGTPTTEIYRGRDGYIHVPADLAGIIVGIFGLDNRRITKRNIGDPPGTAPIPVTEITKLYDFPGNLAAGQSIAIFSEGGYLPTDISANFGGHPPVVVDVKVDSHNLGFADPETTQDIFIAASAAPGATIGVYFTTYTQQGWVDLLTRVIDPDAGDPVCSVLSSSFYVSNGDDTPTLLAEGISIGWLTAVSAAFEDAAIQNVTVCIASGDTGAQSKVGDGRAHVQYPASDPWVLSVGGTTVGHVSGLSFDEYAWNDKFTFGVFTGFGASGGGVSDLFPPPSYQVDAHVPPSVNDGHHGRGVPDVSANASPNSGYPIILGGVPSLFPANGTSASAPLWAGLIAVLNAELGQSAGFINPVIYALSGAGFRDILPEPGATDNTFAGVKGYPVTPGWDAVTGWGSPRGVALLNALKHFYGPAIAVNLQDDLRFSIVCRGPRFLDIRVYNVGDRDLMILGVTRLSGSTDFTVLHAPVTPLAIAPGGEVDFTVEYNPTTHGVHETATIRVTSNDPVTPLLDVVATGFSPSGTIAVTGSTCFGGVTACRCAERTISICNVGICNLQVTSVAFKRKSPHWKLINNPFPATLHPGSCLGVVIRYRATERCPRSCELVITSDDPSTPVKTLDVMAYTVWDDCGCKPRCEDCQKGSCEKRHKEGCCGERHDNCCDEDEAEES